MNVVVILSVIAIIFGAWAANFKLVSFEEFNNSVSSFISIEGSDEYVVATLRSGETLEVKRFNKTLFDLPIGDTEARISVVANYKYFVQLGDIVHHLSGDTLYIKAPDLELSEPVAFDIRSMSESSKTTGFGPDADSLLVELRVKMAKQLKVNGLLQKTSVYERAAKSIADNFNEYMENNGFSGMYEKIVVSFNGASSELSRSYEYISENCGYLPCKINWSVGGYHILASGESNTDRQ
ncbi:hypothetical protein KUV22_16255 [Microbulbifer agarilyticus]|uniref:hypothetical protein n=1 Tax=Microbulbifer agarilyticus TaxID=260552 RepID=UPI001C96BBF6|nr:hypothetical protein [Microbulbifer agarilyticus]MBY6191981.1 hypothetical protein [Microbulbifer agarilyticus]